MSKRADTNAATGRAPWHVRALEIIRGYGPAAVVAAIAFSGSFGHIVKLANKYGQHGWIGYATAAVVDLLCVMAAEERQRDQRIGRKPKWGAVTWPTVVLTGGISLTLAANLATAAPKTWGHVIAAIPAMGLLAAVSILERRAAHTCQDGKPAPATAPQGHQPATMPPATTRPVVAPEVTPVVAGHDRPLPRPVATASGHVAGHHTLATTDRTVVAITGHADGQRGGTAAAMRACWDTAIKTGRVPSGAELNEAAGKPRDYSLGKRYAQRWRQELPAAFIALADAGRTGEATALLPRPDPDTAEAAR
jgi:hypothetical protein